MGGPVRPKGGDEDVRHLWVQQEEEAVAPEPVGTGT